MVVYRSHVQIYAREGAAAFCWTPEVTEGAVCI